MLPFVIPYNQYHTWEQQIKTAGLKDYTITIKKLCIWPPGASKIVKILLFWAQIEILLKSSNTFNYLDTFVNFADLRKYCKHILRGFAVHKLIDLNHDAKLQFLHSYTNGLFALV